ncbi:uncharacterized protein LOC143235440 isoform X2 [Tachypleus tridentatus]|uniref:uncharacterized protein LOC143235440 isoform X2 n=1 Tax=Tachypleus tridentatus TaxID=6853 RepID=UPI003FD28FE4
MKQKTRVLSRQVSLPLFKWDLRFVTGFLLWIFALLSSVITVTTLNSQENEFQGCNHWLKAPSGVISTPNFPKPYPIPIKCQWVIEAPQGKGIAIYFTQFYMREGVRISEYDYYDNSITLSKKDSGIVSSDAEPTLYIGLKSFLVLDFNVQERDNVHMRVMDFFLDVYGFNITYEIIDKQAKRRKDHCIQNHCSFNGVCYASTNYRIYTCKCFESYYGDECEYSPMCGPSSNDSMCSNGGNCRHYIGSRARKCECPKGYYGVLCERKKHATNNNNKGLKLRECQEIGCSYSCKKTPSGTYVCTCPPEYRLEYDFKSCVRKENIRYVISFKILSTESDLTSPNLELLSTVKADEVKLRLQNALLSLLQSNLSKVENLTVLEFKHGPVVQFHFFGEKDENQKVKMLMDKIVRNGQINRYKVEKNYFRFEMEPSLNIQILKTSEKLPVTVGSQLTLECIITGSSKMKVTWFKDGFPINKNTSHQRMWTVVVPKNSQDQFTHLLGFDRIDTLDTGMFTCEVMDWSMIKRKSIQIYVKAPPQPKLVPLTATVQEGDRMEIRCLSQEDISEKFGYTWLKNGEILNPSKEPEYVEDLFRTGSRMVIDSMMSSATYTCIVTSTAGRTSKDSVITVLKPDQHIPVCPEEQLNGLIWNLTVANSRFIHHCPKGFKGIATRYCNSKQNTAEWGDPDFSGCLSNLFVEIKNKFRTLEIGYVQNNLSSILTELKQYLLSRAGSMYSGEGEPVIDLLSDIQIFLRKQLSYDSHSEDSLELILDTTSILLSHEYLIKKQSKLIKIHQHILELGLMRGSIIPAGETHIFHRDTLVLEVKRVAGGGVHVISFLGIPVMESNLKKQNARKSNWLKDKLNLTFDTQHLIPSFEQLNESITVAAVFYKNISVFLPARVLARNEENDQVHQVFSRVVGVAMRSRRNLTGQEAGSLRLKLSLEPNKHILDSHHFLTCGRVDHSHEKFQYFIDGCHQSYVDKQVVCICDRTGTFTLLLASVPEAATENLLDGFEMIAGIGCAVCVSFLCLTLVILVLCWRKVSGAITALKIQFTLTVLGFHITFLKLLSSPLSWEYYPHVISLLIFCLLGAFSIQLCLSLTVYVEFVNLHSIHNLELKIAAMGWAVPVIVVVATLAAQVPEGFHLESWWLIVGTKFFYAFISSGSIITALYILMFVTVKAELKEHERFDSPMLKKVHNRKGLINRSIFVLIALILMSSSSVLYTNNDSSVSKYVFAFASSLLGLVTFLLFTVHGENRHQISFCLRQDQLKTKQQDEPMRIRSNSFKTNSEHWKDSCT